MGDPTDLLRVSVSGVSEAKVGKGAATVTAASAELAPSVARTNVLPSASAVVLKLAAVCPAGMVTVAGTLRTPGEVCCTARPDPAAPCACQDATPMP